jgi:hypothetical protein
MRGVMLSVLAAMAMLAGILAQPRPGQSAAAADDSPIVLELFTSQSCSSCPPADALLNRLRASGQNFLPLSLHVDYWDHIGWRDRYSSPAMTARQRFYAGELGQDTVYTPELVVDGAQGVVGSDEAAVTAAIEAAKARHALGARAGLAASRQGSGVLVTVAAGTGQGRVLLLGFDDQHITAVGGGENAGRTAVDTNVVRSMAAIGDWVGPALALRAAPEAGDHAAVLLQAQDGTILAARLVR